MVTTDNKYKKTARGSYNNNTRYRTNKPVEYRSFLRFLISPSGKMSRDLYVGLRIVMVLTLAVFSIAFSFIPTTNKILMYTANTVSYIIMWVMVAMGYKRAHALGISGFYSIIGTSFAKPFFELNKQDNDYITENIKTPLKKLKKIGKFINKNIWTKLVYLIVSYVIMFGFIVLATNKQGIKAIETLKFVGMFATVNIVQLLLTQLKFFRHFYMQIVKVCMFFLYHLIIVAFMVQVMQNSCIKTCIDLYQTIEAKQEMPQNKKVQKTAPMKTTKK